MRASVDVVLLGGVSLVCESCLFPVGILATSMTETRSPVPAEARRELLHISSSS